MSTSLQRAQLGSDVGVALTGGGTLQEQLQRCAGAVFSRLDAAFARIWTLNSDEQVLELQASAGLYTHLDGPHGRIPIGAFKIGLIAAERKPHLTNGVVGDPRVGDQAWAVQEGMRAFAGYPLLVSGDLVGVMAMFSRNRLSPATLQALGSVADVIALGIGRARADQERQRSAEETRLTIDSALDAIVMMDERGRITNWNPQAEVLFGWTHDEAMGRQVSELLIPERYREAHHQGLRKYQETGIGPVINNRVELTALRRDGTEFPIELTITPLLGSSRPRFSGFIRDITKRKQAEDEIRSLNEALEQRVGLRTAEYEASNRELVQRERALQETQQYLDHLLFASPMVMFRGPMGDVGLTYVSPNFPSVFGYTPEEVLAQAHFLPDQIHPDDKQAFVARVRESASQRGGGLGGTEFRLLHKDGRYRWVQVTVRFETDEQGRRRSVLGYMLDITEQKQAEVAQQQAKAEAERANQAKSEFLSRMSHELRTPMNAILGFTELMAMDDRSADDREALESILHGGRHLLTLINEVLDIARIEAGQLSLSPESVPLDQVLREAISLVEPIAASRGISILGPNALCGRHVFADQQRLKQVFINLLSNAIKYNRPNGRVVVRCEPAPRQRLRILIEDTGIGISPILLDRLFNPFDRLGAEQTNIEGTGLGLALSRRLVEAMQGTIRAESTVGAGSVFSIELAGVSEPAGVVDALEPDAGTPCNAAVAEKSVILYVEDNLSNFRLVERALARRFGVTLIGAMQGALGIELARQHHPDLILLDIQLPDMGGEEVLQRLQADPETRHIPVIAVSADATRHRVQRTLAAGARAYLTKPLEVGPFLALVGDVLTPVVT